LPRYREIYIKKEAKIIVWKITEEENELISLLGNYTLPERFEKYRSMSHRKQFLATQVLLQEENLLDVIKKDDNGKPIIENGYVSISHDSNFVSLMISNKECGIDLQSATPKVLKVKHKYYDENDAQIEGDEVEFLTLIWSLKEAIYKVHGDPMVYFKEHIRIKSVNRNSAECQILHKDYIRDINLTIKKVDDLILAYTN
jgi:phosphopantetheinyl transferase